MQEVTPGILPGSLPPSRVELGVTLTHVRGRKMRSILGLIVNRLWISRLPVAATDQPFTMTRNR
jgi:hypothetical protein